MQYQWIDKAAGTISVVTERAETLNLATIKEEGERLLAHLESLQRDWNTYREKVAQIKADLGIKETDLPDVCEKIADQAAVAMETKL